VYSYLGGRSQNFTYRAGVVNIPCRGHISLVKNGTN